MKKNCFPKMGYWRGGTASERDIFLTYFKQKILIKSLIWPIFVLSKVQSSWTMYVFAYNIFCLCLNNN